MIVIVMGVSGSGKSYLAAKLAEATHWPLVEGDDYHSAANKAKMHAGTPLTDEDRAPWLAALRRILLDWHQQGTPGILTCSALKTTYRDLLAGDIPEARFIWLDPPREVLVERLANRPGHFMSPALLDSQLATMETPTEALRLDGTQPIADELQTILQWLNR